MAESSYTATNISTPNLQQKAKGAVVRSSFLAFSEFESIVGSARGNPDLQEIVATSNGGNYRRVELLNILSKTTQHIE